MTPAPVPTGSPSHGAPAGAERDVVLATLHQLVEALGQALPERTEVVLHDLSLLPQSIVAVHGDVTGRRLGDPATDLLLERAASGRLETMVGYRTALPDGRQMRSATVVVRDSAGDPVAAVCLNSDITVWQQVEQVARGMLGLDAPAAGDEAVPPPAPPPPPSGPSAAASYGPGDGSGTSEAFVRDVDELAAVIIQQAVDEQGVPADLMRKEHKLAVVRSVQRRGMFLLKDAVEMVASALHVTRFTIYNYLNEIGEEGPGTTAPEPSAKARPAR